MNVKHAVSGGESVLFLGMYIIIGALTACVTISIVLTLTCMLVWIKKRSSKRESVNHHIYEEVDVLHIQGSSSTVMSTNKNVAYDSVVVL